MFLPLPPYLNGRRFPNLYPQLGNILFYPNPVTHELKGLLHDAPHKFSKNWGGLHQRIMIITIHNQPAQVAGLQSFEVFKRLHPLKLPGMGFGNPSSFSVKSPSKLFHILEKKTEMVQIHYYMFPLLQ
jgi:hypothetical protein